MGPKVFTQCTCRGADNESCRCQMAGWADMKASLTAHRDGPLQLFAQLQLLPEGLLLNRHRGDAVPGMVQPALDDMPLSGMHCMLQN